jgi:hypothetical protein
VRVGLRDWVESWQCLRRWDWKEKRVFAGRERKLVMGRGERKKQILLAQNARR